MTLIQMTFIIDDAKKGRPPRHTHHTVQDRTLHTDNDVGKDEKDD